MTRTGIEPMSSDFQSGALPLSYPVWKTYMYYDKKKEKF